MGKVCFCEHCAIKGMEFEECELNILSLYQFSYSVTLNFSNVNFIFYILSSFSYF